MGAIALLLRCGIINLNITEALRHKLYDPDEKVRAALCKLIGQLDYETALHHVSVELLEGIAGRGLDKKVS